MDRPTAFAVAAFIAGLAIFLWFVNGVSGRERNAATFAAEVDAIQAQVNALPKDAAAPMTPEQLEQQVQLLSISAGAGNNLRTQLARTAEAHNIEVRRATYATMALSSNSATGDELALLSLGIVDATVITLDYAADYSDAARFIGAIGRLPQRVFVVANEMHREPPRTAGTLTLRVYQRG
jgi:hypothetical protein